MVQKKKIPIFKYEMASLKEETEIISEILYDAIINKSQFNVMLYKKYPTLINCINTNMTLTEIENQVELSIFKKYKYYESEISKSIEKFNENWDSIKNDVLSQLEYDMDSNFTQNVITVKTGNAPLCPRQIENETFYVPSYIFNFNLIALHECCHFLFFSKCDLLYGKNPKQYDYPSYLWLLSELLIDPLLNRSYYISKIGENIKSYDYFYNIIINGKSLVDCIREIVLEQQNPNEYIPKCLKFLNKHINSIKY